MIQENPFQRQTQDILKKQGNVDLNSIMKIVADSRQRKFTNIVQYIQQLVGDPDRKYHPQSLKHELLFLKHFYLSLSTLQVIPQQFIRQIKKQKNQYSLYRILQINIDILLKKGNKVPDQMIQQLIQIVEKNPILKQETLIKFVGCSNTIRINSISKQQIIDTTQNQTKASIKMQIASDWKYIINKQQQALQMKQIALQMWEKINKVSRIQQCKKELDELRKICEGKKTNSIYSNKLKTLRKIVDRISSIEDASQIEQIHRKQKKAAISVIVPHIIAQLQISQDTKQLERSKNVSASVLKQAIKQNRKKGLIQQRCEVGRQFMKQLKKSNYAYCEYVPENKFEYYQKKKLTQILGTIKRKTYKRIRSVFQFLKNLNTSQRQKYWKQI